MSALPVVPLEMSNVTIFMFVPFAQPPLCVSFHAVSMVTSSRRREFVLRLIGKLETVVIPNLFPVWRTRQGLPVLNDFIQPSSL